MAGIQTVDSSGKVALALLGIDNQIKSGNVSQAKYNTKWLQNELSKMKLTDANREIQQKTTALNKAISDEEAARRKVQTLTATNLEDRRKHDRAMTDAELEDINAQSKQKFQHHKALTDERIDNATTQNDQRFKSHQALTDERIDNINAQQDVRNEANEKIADAEMGAFKDRYTNRKADEEDARRNADIERYEKKIDASGWDSLTPFEKQNYNDLQLADTGRDPKEFYGRLDKTQERQFLSQWVDELSKKQNRTPVETQKLFLLRHRLTGGDISNLDASTLSSWLGYNVTQEQLDLLKSEIAYAESQAKQSLVPKTPTNQKYASDLPGVPQSEPAGPTDEQIEQSQSWTSRAGALRQEVGETQAWRANPERAKVQQEQANANPYENIKDLPSDAGTVEYFERKAKENPTPENIDRAKTARDNVVKSLDKTATKSSSSSSKKSGSTSTLNKYDDETKDWNASASKGTLKSGTPEEVRSMWNAHPVISGLNLPTAYTNAGGKKVGGFDWENKKDAAKGLQFSKNFLDQLVAQLRTKQYTPSDVQEVLGDLDRAVKIYGTGGKAPKGRTGGVDAIVHSYANISRYQRGLLTEFRKQLSKYASNQGIKEEQMNPKSTPEEKARSLWMSPDGDFSAWSESYMKGMQPNKGMDSTLPAERVPQQGVSQRFFNSETKQFHEVNPSQVVKDSKGRVTEIVVNGKRMKVPKRMFSMSDNIPLPLITRKQGKQFSTLSLLRAGTPLVIDGKNYRFSGSEGATAHSYFEAYDENGDITRFEIADVRDKIFFPNTLSTGEINRYLRGLADTSSGAKRMLETKRKPFDPNTPDSQKPSQEAQKKNKPTIEQTATAATTTWETLKGGGRVVRLDTEGRAFASVLNLRKAGQKGRGRPGFYDADTGMGIEVELPDWDRNSMPDDVVELEGGTRVDLPEVWKSQEYTTGDGAVYTKDATIRLSGYFAEEVYLEDGKTLNPVGVRAQEALIRMFQQGWVDAKEKNRFIFKVRVVGTPNKMGPLAEKNKKFANPYSDRYKRIVTDVYVAVGGTQKKIGEVRWANPVNELVKRGHGKSETPWGLR